MHNMYEENRVEIPLYFYALNAESFLTLIDKEMNSIYNELLVNLDLGGKS